jgi:hypothetical protein
MSQIKAGDKSAVWKRSQAEVERLTDALGKKIDSGIKETVIAIRAYGFPTQSSCEGHLDRALPYPWVEIYSPEPAQLDWRENDQLHDEWVTKNMQLQKQMLALLGKFYTHSKAPFTDRLIINSEELTHRFRLQSINGPIIKSHPFLDDQKNILTRNQKEMSDFARFLWEYWPGQLK